MEVQNEMGLKARWNRFHSIKRSRFSLYVFVVLFALGIFAELWIGEKPWIAKINDNICFPLIMDYSEEDLGGEYKTLVSWEYYQKAENLGEEDWTLGPVIKYDPLKSDLDVEGTPPFAPSWDHPLGTDASGRDMLSRLVYGFRIGILFSLGLTVLGTFFGVLIGGVQGYMGGKVDLGVQRFTEIWSALPFLYVVILVGALVGRGFWILVIVMALFQWIGLAYYMRGEFLRLRNSGFVRAAKALGMPAKTIFWKEMLPNALSPVITLLPFQLIGGISALTALDFLGFGLQPPTPSWGELLSQGLNHLYAPWITVFTVFALSVTLLLFTFIGEGLREAFDPKGGSND
jgi:microcin C transport system permease protein